MQNKTDLDYVYASHIYIYIYKLIQNNMPKWKGKAGTLNEKSHRGIVPQMPSVVDRGRFHSNNSWEICPLDFSYGFFKINVLRNTLVGRIIEGDGGVRYTNCMLEKGKKFMQRGCNISRRPLKTLSISCVCVLVVNI